MRINTLRNGLSMVISGSTFLLRLYCTIVLYLVSHNSGTVQIISLYDNDMISTNQTDDYLLRKLCANRRTKENGEGI